MASLSFRVLPRAETTVDHEQQRRERNRAFTIAVFVLPGLFLFLTFFLVPITQATQYSLYRWDGFGPLENFVGLGNYEQLLNQKVFHSAIAHTMFITTASLAIQLPLAMLLALLLGRGNLRGKKLFRILLFVPYVFSEVITAIIWSYVFQTNNGFLNSALQSAVPGYQPIAWLGEQNLVLLSIFAVVMWKYFGFYMILYMAALNDIPKHLEEAARIDGATEMDVLRFVTLPLLGNTIRLTVFLSVLGSFQQFVIFWVLTQGGPVNASEVIGTYLYKYGIQRFALGYGSAVAVVLFLLMLVFSIGYQRMMMRRDYHEFA